jgi:TonB family protein
MAEATTAAAPATERPAPPSGGTGFLVAPVAIAGTAATPAERRRHLASLAAAVGAHAAVLAWLATSPLPSSLGLDGIEIDIVSIEILPAAALDARAAAEPAVVMAALAPVEDRDGAVKPSEAGAASPEREARRPSEPAKPAAAGPDIVVADWIARHEPPKPDEPTIVIGPKPAEPTVEPREEEPDYERRPHARPAASAASASLETSSLGGAAASTREASDQPSPAQAGAASGASMTTYHRELVAALGTLQRKVQRSAARQAAPGRGKVVLRLTIGRDGAAEAIGVATPSGTPALDRRAVAEVQGFRFPAPPGPASEAQRTYLLPITFR